MWTLGRWTSCGALSCGWCVCMVILISVSCGCLLWISCNEWPSSCGACEAPLTPWWWDFRLAREDTTCTMAMLIWWPSKMVETYAVMERVRTTRMWGRGMVTNFFCKSLSASYSWMQFSNHVRFRIMM